MSPAIGVGEPGLRKFDAFDSQNHYHQSLDLTSCGLGLFNRWRHELLYPKTVAKCRIFSRLERHEDGIRVVLPQSYAAKTSTVLNRRFLWRKWQAIVLLTKSDVGHHPYTLHSNQQGSSSR
jgi:hypothetical protein